MIKLRWVVILLGLLFELIHRTYPLCWVIVLTGLCLYFWEHYRIDDLIFNKKKGKVGYKSLGKLMYSNTFIRSTGKVCGINVKHLFWRLFWKI